MAKATIHRGKKTGALGHPLTLSCMPVEQSGYELYVFKMKASLAWKIFSISRREPGANNGYQRAYTYDSLCRTTQVASTITTSDVNQ